MQGTYTDVEFNHWGLKQRIVKTATLLIQLTDSNWRECDVEQIDGVYQFREHKGITKVKVINIRGLEHITEKWIDENELRWRDNQSGKWIRRGFFAPEEAQS